MTLREQYPHLWLFATRGQFLAFPIAIGLTVVAPFAPMPIAVLAFTWWGLAITGHITALTWQNIENRERGTRDA